MTPNTPCICLSREIPDKRLLAGCLLYGYGSTPSRNAVLEKGFSKAVNAVAGIISNTLEACLQDNQNNSDPQYIASETAKSLREASKYLFELGHLAGQGIYVGGVIAYFSELQYVATAFGGASLMLFENGLLHDLNNSVQNGLIYDAVGSKKGWSGKFNQGTLPNNGLLLGATGYPHDQNKCEKQLAEYIAPGIHVNTGATILCQLLAPDPMAAAIEFREN
jgi:hypothetical protein